MIQLQFYNKGLTKTQIEHILNNYKLKYTTLTNEINSKLNSLIKTILNDITPFLENIEEISKELKHIREMENDKVTIELLKNRLKEKSLIERQLQNDITSLKKEISDLKELKEKNINKIDSSDNLLKQNVNSSPLKQKSKSGKVGLVSNNTEIKPMTAVPKTPRRNSKPNLLNKLEDNSSKSMTLNSASSSNIHKKDTIKNKNKNNYMKNMQEITRSINGYHNQVQANRTNEKINKFICFSNKKVNKKDVKNKNPKNKKSKSIDYSYQDEEQNVNNKKKANNNVNKTNNKQNINNKEKNDINNNDNNDIIEEEDIEEEIRELEIDEQSILKLIEDIKNFEKSQN